MCYEDKTKEELIEELRIRDTVLYEQNLKNSKTILEAILQSATDGILVIDYNEEILHINKRFNELWNIPQKAILEKDIWKITHYLKNQLVDPEAFILSTRKIIDISVEYKDIIYLKNGRVLERYSHPLILNNKPIGTVINFRDITQKSILENKLIRNQKLYRRLIELLPDGILVYRDNKLFLVNQAASKLLKQSKKDILGKKSGSMAKIHPDYRDEAFKKIAKLHQNESVMDYSEYKLILHDGTEIDIETGAFSFKNEGHFFITSIIRDITERKKIRQLEETVSQKSELLKEAQEYNRLKTQLFSTISHELKTPLNIIFGSVQLLEKLYNGASLNKYLKIMKQNCYRLLRLINNLIDLNKFEIGYYKLELNKCNIVKVIEDITLSVVDYTSSKGIELIFDTDVEEKYTACDAEKLERVILNLLSNAIKFTEPGGNIKVSIHDNVDNILISVKDSGIGIPEDMLDKIFEAFRQVDSSLRRKVEGSGLGLSIVKFLIEMHGGNISAKSHLGNGSEFLIELPINPIPDIIEGVQEYSPAAIDSKVEKVSIEFSDIYS
ncbi:PAS domain-containing sensor histidine kinase [Clostridium swellfunianum]|uniref:sensor histidine kinase n=1 Tax=Clostridium swellfunianum TaxID=1367462 RepID=UPI0020304207|nr:PAS domain-containing sensor histidine kinase [Clostridium swellfunianum]MCM0649683.1 PAS domain-containing sensor histidine kinase [Clostridium swellfunianum]